MIARTIRWLCVCTILLAGCNTPTLLPPAPPSPTPPSATSTSARSLTISLLYPKADTETEMGQSVKFIVRVTNADGQTVPDAQVTLTLHDASGRKVAAFPAAAGSGQVYRTEAVAIPHRTLEGKWNITVEASTTSAQGTGSGAFAVKNSTSEILMNKYGFWLDAPTLKGIVPQLGGAR